jgi:hypothetical protein
MDSSSCMRVRLIGLLVLDYGNEDIYTGNCCGLWAYHDCFQPWVEAARKGASDRAGKSRREPLSKERFQGVSVMRVQILR